MRLTSWLLRAADAVRRTTLSDDELRTGREHDEATEYIARAEAVLATVRGRKHEHLETHESQALISAITPLLNLRKRCPNDERIAPVLGELRDIALGRLGAPRA